MMRYDHTEYLACAEPMRRAGLSAAAETLCVLCIQAVGLMKGACRVCLIFILTLGLLKASRRDCEKYLGLQLVCFYFKVFFTFMSRHMLLNS